MKSITATALLFCMVPALASAKLVIKPEEQCVSKGDLKCTQVVYKNKSAQHNKQIFCGDSYVYGDVKAKQFVKRHIAQGYSLILTHNGQYKDGYCTD